jgi:cytochrome c2
MDRGLVDRAPNARTWSAKRVRCARAAIAALAALGAARASAEPPAARAAALFQSRCTACHTFGKGVKVGPDLKGVTRRRPREWLHRFIHSSSALIAAGDPTATHLFEQFARRRMPDWTDLTTPQIDELLDWLAAGGPERRPADERNAETAAAADVARGRALFGGAASFGSGTPACTSCHAAPGGARLASGSLGPDLADAYPRMQDWALTEWLRRRCVRVGRREERRPYLAPDEIFALKAFLRDAAHASPERPPRSGAAAELGSGAP